MKKPRKKRLRAPGGGRKALPQELRKVSMSVRVPRYVRDGFDARANAAGVDAKGRKQSSRGIEVERAYNATEPSKFAIDTGGRFHV